MRVFWRGCLVWLVGYPLSVLVATTLLSAAVWAFEIRGDAIAEGLGMMARRGLEMLPVVAFFSLLPAALTPSSPKLRSYVVSGARTGAVGGALVMGMFAIITMSAAFDQLGRWLGGGTVAAGSPTMLHYSAAIILGFVLWFAFAGAAGGFVFGLFARQR